MASRESKKKPPTLDEETTDDLEAEFLKKLDGYEPRARVSERYIESDERREGTDAPPQEADGKAPEDGFVQFRDAFEASEFAVDELSEGAAASGRAGAGQPPAETAEADKQRKLTHAEMMEEAFDSIGSGDAVHAGKFRGQGYDVGEEVQIVDDLSLKEEIGAPSGGQPEDDPDDDDLLFYEMMAADDVRPVESKRVEPLPGRRELPDAARWRSVSELRTLSEKDLLEPTLTRDQRERLKRSRSRRMHVLNIRQMRRDEALSSVKVFVSGAARRGIPFVRVITGKGKQSEGLPVLKRAVIEWVENHGGIVVRGWAPETDRGGNYGSVVLELRVDPHDD